MSFCGTIRDRNSGQFLTLALHTIVLYDPLIKVEDLRHETRGRKKVDTSQLALFPLTEKQAVEHASFAKTLRYFLEAYQEDVIKTKPKDDRNMFGRNGRLYGLEFCEYDFYDFWYGIIKQKGVEKFEQKVQLLEKIGENVPLDDYEPAIKFLSEINSRALAHHRYNQGGCF